jgi:LCP family protein required for cell wall assembly
MGINARQKKIRNLRIMMVAVTLLIIGSTAIFIKDAAIGLVANNVITNENLSSSLEPTTFLFIGSDEDQTMAEGARSDVLMVATFTPDNVRGNMEMNVVSIPRDSVTNIVCGDYDYYGRINEAYSVGYSEGGTQEAIDCTVATVENYLNIEVDYYIATSFTGLIEMVDAIGGIEIDVHSEFCQVDSQEEEEICFEPGLQTLNGEQSLAYARERHTTSDYERGIRQQQIMLGIVKKVLSDPDQYLGPAIGVFSESMESNLDVELITKITNSVISNYNQYIENMGADTPVVIQLKDSPYSNENSIGGAIGGVTGIDTTNVEAVPMSTLYPEVSEFEEDTMVQELYFSKKATDLASTPQSETATQEALIIEFQSISIKQIPFTSIDGASLSYADLDTLNYVSNTIRQAAGDPIEEPTFNFYEMEDIVAYYDE